MGGKGEVYSGTTIKDTWTKLRGWWWKQGKEEGMEGMRVVVGGKCRQLYLNNSKIIKKK